MIGRVIGELASVSEHAVLIMVGGVGYDVLVSPATAEALLDRRGREVAVETIAYIEGNPAVGSLAPRLVGFLNAEDRKVYEHLIKVRGVSMRKALRAMAVPTSQLVRAIEGGDAGFLQGLPEIGAKTANQIVQDVQGKLAGLLAEESPSEQQPATLNDEQRMAVDVLVGWGEKPADAQRWVHLALRDDPTLNTAEAVVRAAYRMKQARRGAAR